MHSEPNPTVVMVMAITKKVMAISWGTMKVEPNTRVMGMEMEMGW